MSSVANRRRFMERRHCGSSTKAARAYTLVRCGETRIASLSTRPPIGAKMLMTLAISPTSESGPILDSLGPKHYGPRGF
jgi:hypothetical protein